MSMQSWAEKEIEIACRRERADSKIEDGDWDYGCACYESALKAYKSLMSDGHSGFSIGLTKHILNRLIDGKPLTPIEDTPDIWNDISEYRPEEGHRDYQCKRMGSLFKYVYDDGRIEYKDVNFFYCIDTTNGVTYYSGLVQRVMDEMFPISMPYMPTEPIKVYCSELLTDRKNGDFDTVAILHVIKPNGDRIDINRFFKENGNDWAEITIEEYEQRKDMELKRLQEETPEFMKKEFYIPNPQAIDLFGSDTRKIFANEYIDDRMSTRFKLPFVKRETGINDDIINKVECTFGFPLYDWQKRYLKGEDNAIPNGGRQNGKTFAYCIRLLLGNHEPFDLHKPCEVDKLVDENHGPYYTSYFRSYLRNLNDQLLSAGFNTNAEKKNYSEEVFKKGFFYF